MTRQVGILAFAIAATSLAHAAENPLCSYSPQRELPPTSALLYEKASAA